VAHAGPQPLANSSQRESTTRRLAQHTSISFAGTLVLAGIAASIGTVDDPYHNALAETTIWLFKTEAVPAGHTRRDPNRAL
jgi:hypothetical protein